MQQQNFLVFFTLSQLYKQRVHLGVVSSNLNTNAIRYLLPIKSQFSLIDLHYTSTLLKTSFNYMLEVLKHRGTVLVVNESKFLKPFLKEEFQDLQQPVSYLNWPSGLLTNFKAVRRNSLKTYFLKRQFILRLFQLDSRGLLSSKTRNVIKSSFNFLKFKKELGRYIKSLNRLPNIVFTFDSLLSDIPLSEARRLGIASFGLVDSNADSFKLNYGIPGNSTSIVSLTLYFKFLRLLFLKGQLLERRNFLHASLLKKQEYRGLNFLISQYLAQTGSSLRYSLDSFRSFFFERGALVNPFLDLYRRDAFTYKGVASLNKGLYLSNRVYKDVAFNVHAAYNNFVLNSKLSLDRSYNKEFKEYGSRLLRSSFSIYLYAKALSNKGWHVLNRGSALITSSSSLTYSPICGVQESLHLEQWATAMCYLGKSQVPVAICNSNSGLWGPRYSLEGASKEATLDNVGSLQVQKLAAYYVEPLKYNLLFISSKVK